MRTGAQAILQAAEVETGAGLDAIGEAYELPRDAHFQRVGVPEPDEEYRPRLIERIRFVEGLLPRGSTPDDEVTVTLAIDPRKLLAFCALVASLDTSEEHEPSDGPEDAVQALDALIHKARDMMGKAMPREGGTDTN